MVGRRTGIKAGQAYVAINAIDQVTPVLRRIHRNMMAFGAQMRTIGKQMALSGLVLGAGLVFPLTKMIKEASDFQESMNFFNQVFAENSDAVREWSDSIADSIGRPRREMMELMARSGAMFDQLKLGTEDTIELSKVLTQLAIDYASLRNLSDDRAFAQIFAAIQGRPVSLSLGGGATILNEVVEEFAKTEFGLKGITNIDFATKALMRMMIVVGELDESTGDAVRTGRFFANVMKRIRAAVLNTAKELGDQMLPAVTALSEMLLVLGGSVMDDLNKNFLKWTLIIGATSAALIGTGLAIVALGVSFQVIMPTLIASQIALTVATMASSAALAAWGLLLQIVALGPVGLLLTGIALVIAGLAMMTVALGFLTGTFQAVFATIAGKVGSWFEEISSIFHTMMNGIIAGIKNGQVEAAWGIMLNGIQQMWVETFAFLKISALEFFGWFSSKIGGILPGFNFSDDTSAMASQIGETRDAEIARLSREMLDLRNVAETPRDFSASGARGEEERLKDLENLRRMITERLAGIKEDVAGTKSSSIGGIWQGSVEETKRVNETANKELEITRKIHEELQRQTRELEDIGMGMEDQGAILSAAGA